MVLVTLNVPKKFIDNGTITKYPKRTPIKNKIEVTKTNTFAFFRSFSYNAGLIKRQTSYNIYGNPKTNPAEIKVHK